MAQGGTAVGSACHNGGARNVGVPATLCPLASSPQSWLPAVDMRRRVQAAGMHHGSKGAAALLAGWKNNPNERKHIATNRRRK